MTIPMKKLATFDESGASHMVGDKKNVHLLGGALSFTDVSAVVLGQVQFRGKEGKAEEQFGERYIRYSSEKG